MTAVLASEDETRRVLFGSPEDDPETTSALSTSLVDGEPATRGESANALSALEQSSPNEPIPVSQSSQVDYDLPQCSLPPLSQLQPVETFVLNAIKSRHDEAPEAAHVQGYKAIIDTIRKPIDPNMIRSVLILFEQLVLVPY